MRLRVEFGDNDLLLLLDGVPVPQASVEAGYDDDPLPAAGDAADEESKTRERLVTFEELRSSTASKDYYVTVDMEVAPESLYDVDLDEVSPEIASLHFNRWRLVGAAPVFVTHIDLERNNERRFVCECQISFNIKLLELNGKEHAFAALLDTQHEPGVTEVAVDDESVEIVIKSRKRFATLRECEQYALDAAAVFLADVRNSPDPRTAVSITFEFPPAVRSACEQYLLHFGDFLRDLGVEASVRLQELGDHVLFAVAPRDRRDALDNIRSALDAYLQMSVAELVGKSTSTADEIMLFKLRANISHLHSQLDLAHAQNAALRDRISAQQLALQLLHNGQLRGSSGPSEREATTSSDAGMERVNRYVAITPMKHGPLRIDLPQLIRDLRALFRRDGGA